MKKSPRDILAGVSEDAADAYTALRGSVKVAGPLDAETADLIVAGTLVAKGDITGLKVHASRMLREGSSIDALKQAAVVGIGVTSGFGDVLAAIRVLDEISEG